jgi:chromosomal replication initiator protein
MSYAAHLKAHYRAIRRRLDLPPNNLKTITGPSLAGQMSSQRPRPTVDAIQRLVCEQFGVEQAELLARRRDEAVVMPRQIAMFLVRELTRKSYPDIARRFGRSNHATVIHACRRVQASIARDPKRAGLIEALRHKLASSER